MNSKQKTMNNEQLSKCVECGLHYRDKKLAEQCEAFCKKHMACSMEIAPQAVENEKRQSA